MDYSLLIGLHELNSENVLNELNSEIGLNELNSNNGVSKPTTSINSLESNTNTSSLESNTNTSSLESNADIPSSNNTSTTYNPFTANYGGFQASFANNQPAPEVYYLGIIDILTPYSLYKRLETTFKGLVLPRDAISAVSPSVYAKRFLRFMNANILRDVNSDYSQRPLPPIESEDWEKVIVDSVEFVEFVESFESIWFVESVEFVNK